METPTQTALILSAQAGDRTAFDTLVEPYQRELLVHCYRMLGSVHDAEDLVQETLIRAWEKRATFTSPGSYRAWLYRIATNLCLNVLSRNPRRILPSSRYPATDPSLPLPKDVREPIWLEPFPDELLAGPYTDPEAHTLLHERITLAFLVAIQHLTPTQRAILLLREVLEWDARETAEWLNLSVPAVNSCLVPGTSSHYHVFSDDHFHLPWQMATASDVCECQPGFWGLSMACRGWRVSAFWAVGSGDDGRAGRTHGRVPGTLQPLALCPA